MINMDLDLVELNRWLEGFMNFERLPNKSMLKLETMRVLCDEFGRPERSCPCFHVAGSKGKGTIAATTAAMLTEAGYKVGVYASPHVRHFTERVSLNGKPFAAEIYDAAFAELRAGIERIVAEGKLKRAVITWYELVTVFAMLCFRKAEVDYAVYEVGMGGRLDATNVVQPDCVMMGLIELEHTKYLGDTLEKIATEKAGVFKKGVPVVSVMQDAKVMKVFQKFATEKGIEVTYVSKGAYYEEDVWVAKEAMKKVVPEISEEMLDVAVGKVYLPGRYEWVRNVLIDGAHTVKSIEAVLARMKADGVTGDLLFGCAADKNVERMAEEIVHSGMFRKIYLTRPGDFKKADLERMVRAFTAAELKELRNDTICVDGDYKRLISEAIREAEGRTLVVLGSFYLAGEAKKTLEAYA